MGVNTLYETTNFHVIASNRRAFAHSRVPCVSPRSKVVGDRRWSVGRSHW